MKSMAKKQDIITTTKAVLQNKITEIKIKAEIRNCFDQLNSRFITSEEKNIKNGRCN
jgi:hypothetical protein